MRHPATRANALLAVLGLACAASVPLMFLGGDQAIADLLFRLEGGRWALRDAWLTATLIHGWGRSFSMACLCMVVVAWAMTWTRHVGRAWRRPLAYLIATALASTLVVSALKQRTGLECPWDLVRYGGDRIALGPFALRPSTMGKAACFPAGHASAGYGWLAAYFALAAVRPRWRWWGLGFGLSLGATFGIAQQLRGAHFLSHDLWTLTLCWLVAAGSARLWLPHATSHAEAEAVVPSHMPADADRLIARKVIP